MFLRVIAVAPTAFLGPAAPTDCFRLACTSRAAHHCVSPEVLKEIASRRPDEGWLLANYLNYADVVDVDFVYTLLSKEMSCRRSGCPDPDLIGPVLGAALERAGRQQHRPYSRRAFVRVIRLLLSHGAEPNCRYTVGNLGVVMRPLLFIPMAHGDVPLVRLLLQARAHPEAQDTAGEPVLCTSLRNVLCAGDGARDVFDLLLASARDRRCVPLSLRTLARRSLKSALLFAEANRSQNEEERDAKSANYLPRGYWWLGGRGVRLARRLFSDVERASAGYAPLRRCDDA